MGKKEKKTYKTKIVVLRSKEATRRKKHSREATEVGTSKPYRITEHRRNKRRTKEQIDKVIKKYLDTDKIPKSLRDQRILERRGLI